MTNGVGTWFCKAHFDAGWGWDDAVECAMFLYFPVWPLRTLHVRELRAGSFAPEEYQAIPLRWSNQLVRFVFLRRWFAGVVGLGLVLLLTLAVVIRWPPQGRAATEWAVLKPIVAPLAPCPVASSATHSSLLHPQGEEHSPLTGSAQPWLERSRHLAG
jgi:hypothetical protein